MLKPIFILLLNAIIGSCITTKNGATTLKPAIPVKSTVPTTVRAATAIKKTSTRKTTFRSTTTTTIRSTLVTTMPSSTVATNVFDYALIMGIANPNVEVWYPGNTTSCINPPSIPNMPDIRQSFSAALLGNMIIYCGGRNPQYVTNTCYSYTSGSTGASWVSAPPMITKRECHSMTAVNGMIVAAGGRGCIISNYCNLSGIEVFKNGIWQNLGWKMAIPRIGHCAVKFGNINLMVIGGIPQDGSIINTVEQLDTVTGKWTMVKSLNFARCHHSCVSYTKGAIEHVVVAGGLSNGENGNSVELFSSDTNVWVQLPSMNSGRWGQSMGILDGYPTVFGGWGTVFGGGANVETEYLNGTVWMKGKKLQQGRISHRMVQIKCV